MIARTKELNTLRGLLKRHRVVGLVGARQVGKTTLARAVANSWNGNVSFFDMENPADRARLADPMLALDGLTGLIVIDEIQRTPNLFPVLRVLVDKPVRPPRFLVLGSASPELLRQGSETLAGRIYYHEVGGFALDEVGIAQHMRLWSRGQLPRSYLAPSAAASFEWRQGFVRTFLERDLPQFGFGISSAAMERFWSMLAHYHGQTWNSSEFGRAFGVADTTVRGYLDRLTSSLVVRQLLPWHANVSKRQVRAPKIYIADTGILHVLLNLRTQRDVEFHPKVGASWEGFALEQVVRRLRADWRECFFWATHAGAELDLLVVRDRHRIGFEFKHSSSPYVTPSMRSALQTLGLTRLHVIYPGKDTFPLGKNIVAVGLSGLFETVQPLR